MGAGMFAQQAAHKVSAASEDKQVNSLVGLELFCSAEGYYLAGRFNGSTTGRRVVRSFPCFAASGRAAVGGRKRSAPGRCDAPSPRPAPDPAAPELAAAAETRGSAPAGAELPCRGFRRGRRGPEPAAPEPPMPDALAGAESKEPAAEMPEVGAPEPAGEALAADQAAEVLPPPAPDAEPRVPGDNFGKFADDPSYVAPPRSSVRPPLPASMTAPAGRTYLDATAGQASRYVNPSDLVRDRAVARGEQRRQRIETRKWLGISPLRPAVDSTPFTAVEQPAQLLLVVPDTSSTVKR